MLTTRRHARPVMIQYATVSRSGLADHERFGATKFVSPECLSMAEHLPRCKIDNPPVYDVCQVQEAGE